MESDWLNSTDPAAMLRWLTTPFGERSLNHPEYVVSDRKLRLFACATIRRKWEDLWSSNRDFVEAVERYVDGQSVVLPEAQIALFGVPPGTVSATVSERPWADAAAVAKHIARLDCYGPKAEVAALLRDIFGNPFRPLVSNYHVDTDNWLVFGDGTVTAIARGIYDDNRWADMPILGDALLDTGCQDENLLKHCQGLERCAKCLGKGECWMTRPTGSWTSEWYFGTCDLCGGNGWRTAGPHVRGCWLVDLLLGKE